jgi:hypothetical protein
MAGGAFSWVSRMGGMKRREKPDKTPRVVKAAIGILLLAGIVAMVTAVCIWFYFAGSHPPPPRAPQPEWTEFHFGAR